MKKYLLPFVLLLFAFNASAQLVISEISYNPPETNTDSLEYIELYNETANDIDLANYVIRDNNPHTIAEGTVPANGYAILAINPGAIMAVLGVTPIEIADIALNNGGEIVTIEDPNGNVLDEVEYMDMGVWPSFEDGTDGIGATIELCDLTSNNNNGSNWAAATNDLGVTIDGKSFLGTPAAANTAVCGEFVPEHIVEVSSNIFTPADITIQVDETVRWMNTGGQHNVNGTTESYPDNPEGFTNGIASSDLWTYDFRFTIPGEYDYRCDPHFNFGMVGTVSVGGEIEEPIAPTYDIGVVNTTNSDGVGDSLMVECMVVGISHGANLRSGGVQCALIDESGDAMGLFSNGDLGYEYAEGDELRVTGIITQFNGVLQITASAIEVISTGNDLMGPIIVTELNESTESKLVKIEGLTISDPNDWDTSDGDFNVVFDTPGGQTITVRVDADTEIIEWEEGPVEGTWKITGIGGQFDQDAPLDSGYQMFPRYVSDFDNLSGVDEGLDARINVYPNPAANVVNIDSDVTLDRFTLYNKFGEVVMEGAFRSSLDVTELPSGNYLIVLSKDDKKRIVQFVK